MFITYHFDFTPSYQQLVPKFLFACKCLHIWGSKVACLIGFKDVKTACCGNHTQQGISDCKKGGYVCPNRDEYLFWDAYHPSQAAVKLAARELVFGEDPKFVTPINFSTLKRA